MGISHCSDRFANQVQVLDIEQCGIDIQVCWTSLVYVGYLLDRRLFQSRHLPASEVPRWANDPGRGERTVRQHDETR
jgi:hypothetical protein